MSQKQGNKVFALSYAKLPTVTMGDWAIFQADGSSSAMDPNMTIQPQIKSTPTYPKNLTINVYEDKKNQTELESLKKRLENLEKVLGVIKDGEIEIRDITYAQAKKEIAQFYLEHHGELFDAADVEEELGIEFEMTMQICEELEKEGKIKSAK